MCPRIHKHLEPEVSLAARPGTAWAAAWVQTLPKAGCLELRAVNQLVAYVAGTSVRTISFGLPVMNSPGMGGLPQVCLVWGLRGITRLRLTPSLQPLLSL